MHNLNEELKTGIKPFFRIKYKYYTFAEMGNARKILYPFSLLYGGIMHVRNELYDRDILKSQRYDLPVIGVGNLSVGGTGKSPMVEYLISLLKEELRVATLSRGYKRTTSGFLLLTGNENASETGDEPLQFKRKFPEVMVAVDEVRSHGIEQLLNLHPKPEVILLDDAFQHRKVSAGLNILLTPYNSLYSKDLLLPAGNLREPVSGAQRAQLIIVTKCPEDLQEDKKNHIRRALKLKKGQELFFSTISYSKKVQGAHSSINLADLKKKKITLVTGIANPDLLVRYLKEQGLKFQHLKYPDHHNFTTSELEKINEHSFILTTEKDFMRLKGQISQERLFFLPIRTSFLERQQEFDHYIKTFAIKK